MALSNISCHIIITTAATTTTITTTTTTIITIIIMHVCILGNEIAGFESFDVMLYAGIFTVCYKLS